MYKNDEQCFLEHIVAFERVVRVSNCSLKLLKIAIYHCSREFSGKFSDIIGVHTCNIVQASKGTTTIPSQQTAMVRSFVSFFFAALQKMITIQLYLQQLLLVVRFQKAQGKKFSQKKIKILLNSIIFYLRLLCSPYSKTLIHDYPSYMPFSIGAELTIFSFHCSIFSYS